MADLHKLRVEDVSMDSADAPTLPPPEVDERLWEGASAQGWTVLPRGDLEAARRNSSWVYVDRDDQRYRKRSEAVEAFRADVDKRLWAGAAHQGWCVILRGPRNSGKWWYIDRDGNRYTGRAAALEAHERAAGGGAGNGQAPAKAGEKRPADKSNGHAKKRPRPEQEAEPPPTQQEHERMQWLKPSSLVEVEMREDGLRGSRYAARILSVGQTHALVEFLAFQDEGAENENLKEWLELDQLWPPPPPPPPEWWRGLSDGDTLELFHEDGWWEVLLRHRRAAETTPPSTEFLVVSVEYRNEQWVDVSLLRPQWRFAGTCRQYVWQSDWPPGLVVYDDADAVAAHSHATAQGGSLPLPGSDAPAAAAAANGGGGGGAAPAPAPAEASPQEADAPPPAVANGVAAAGTDGGSDASAEAQVGGTSPPRSATTAALLVPLLGSGEAALAQQLAAAQAELERERGARRVLLRCAEGYQRHIAELKDAFRAHADASFLDHEAVQRAVAPLPAQPDAQVRVPRPDGL